MDSKVVDTLAADTDPGEDNRYSTSCFIKTITSSFFKYTSMQSIVKERE
jgi:hypothetical protein